MINLNSGNLYRELKYSHEQRTYSTLIGLM